MVLPADRELAFQGHGRIGERARKIAARDMIRFRMKTVLLDRFWDRENWRQRFMLKDNFVRRAATSFLRFANN